MTIELQDKSRVSSLIYEALKITQVLGGLFLTIRSLAQPDTGSVVDFIGRSFSGVDNQADNDSQEAFQDFQRSSIFAALLLPFFPFDYKAKNKVEKVV